jgi:hypothetical protein
VIVAANRVFVPWVIDCGGPEHSAQLLHVDARYMVAKNRTKRVQAPMIPPAIYLMTPKVETAIDALMCVDR